MNSIAKYKIKKATFNFIKPFVPFLVFILILFFLLCTIIDAVFIVDTDTDTVMQTLEGYYTGNLSASESIDNTSIDSTGSFIWPVPGYTTISSSFGMRTHPITGQYKLHSGVDVSAPIGADFVAMADGTVIEAGYNTAYGNIVKIDHRK